MSGFVFIGGKAVPNSYYRSRDGRVWHLPSCHRIGKGSVRWIWADGRTPTEVVAELEAARLSGEVKPCRVCKPDLEATS